MPEPIPAAPGSPNLPSVLLDDDGDLWIDLKGTGEYRYLSPYATLGHPKTFADLVEDNDNLREAEWDDA